MSQHEDIQESAVVWNNYAELYDSNMGDTGDKFHSEIIDPPLMEILGDVRSLAVLDVGCGNGYLAHSIAHLGARKVIGLDYSTKLIKLATDRFSDGSVEFHVANLLHPWPLKNSEIDVIVANMVLQYLPDIVTFAKEAKRVLKPEGQIVFSVDHPSHALFIRALVLAGLSNTKFRSSTPYFETSYCLKQSLWDQAIVGYYHRPLEQYFSPFLATGFQLLAFKELGRTIEISSKAEVIPRVAILGFRNNGGVGGK